MEGIIVVTYRCNARCHMCNTWKFPTTPEQEMEPKCYERLPSLKFLNITGGEPFLREDLGEIVSIVKRKSRRICISTNGYFTERILALAEEHPDVGFRISLEGLPKSNDELRGLPDGFDHGLRTLLELKRMGIKDIGFGITVSDRNAKDLMELYELAKGLDVEFATAIVHNGYYFHKQDNAIQDKEAVSESFRALIREMFKSRRVKNWFRAYFNHGIINYVNGGERSLPCRMGEDMFLVEPWGDVKPCNVLDETMGNIRETDFQTIWNSAQAEEVRLRARNCGKQCWMIGSVSPAMKRDLWTPIKWILKNKLNY
jgi:MoaA/NifB/PqqE/SkfB family radical SAM enzyme